MTENSRARFPRLWDYLDSLPKGLESYPECFTKASLVVSAFEDENREDLLPELPDALTRLVTHPPPLGVWVPAVHSDAVFHAVCDRFYPTEQEMIDWCKARTVRLASNRLYRAVLRVSGPRALFAMATRAHGLFQRGTVVKPLELSHSRILAQMTFPPGLHNHFNLLANLPLFETMAELTGAASSKASLLAWTETSADYEVVWS